jgi:hypothetical protein
MHTSFTPAAYHEPNRLDSNPTDPTQPNPLIMWKVHVAHDHEHGCHDSYTLQRLHNFIHRLVISSLAKWLKVSILPNVHILWCMARRSPHSFLQCFPAHKIFTLRFHRCESHILQRHPLVPRLGDKPTPSPKSRKSHHVLLPQIFTKLGKQHVTRLSLPISALCFAWYTWLHTLWIGS